MKSVLAACILAITVSSGGETFETYDDFSITLPDGWVEIPGYVLEAYAEKVDEIFPNTPRQVYDYGYQIGNDGKSITYPYILVQVRSIGRIPWGALARVQEMNSQTEDIGLSVMRVGEATYDKENQILSSTLSAHIQGGEKAKILIAIKLTQLGYIKFSGCATEDSFDEYEIIFREAFTSLGIDESIAYKPQFGDAMPVIGGIMMGKVLVWCIQAVVIGGFLWLIYIFVKQLIRKGKI